MPHGPAHAVLVAAAATIHGPAGCGGAGNSIFSGWPESMRLMSGSGPLGPTFHGVWQSLHPEVVTRYLPRAALSAGATVLAPPPSAASSGCVNAAQASPASAAAVS